MIKSLPLLVALLPLSGPASTLGAEPAAVAERFVAAVAADDLPGLAALAEDGAFASPGWQSPIDLAERLDGIVVDSHHVEAAESDDDGVRSVWLEVAGSGRTFGGDHVRIPLPKWWHLALVAAPEGGWKLRSALTLERKLANELATADRAAIDAAVSREARLDRRTFRIDLADVASDHQEAGRAAGEWAVVDARAAGDAAGEAAVHAKLVALEVSTGPAAIVARAEQVLAAARRSGEPHPLALASFAVGIGQWFSDDIPAAVESLLGGASAIEQLRDPRIALRGLYMASLLENREGRLSEVMAITARLRGYLDRWPWRRGEMDLAFMLGSLYGSVGKPEVAVETYTRGEQAAVAVGDGRGQALMVYNQALDWREVGDAPPGTLHLSRATALARRYLVSGELAQVLSSAAVELGENGKRESAEALFGEALAIAATGDERRIHANILRSRSELYRRSGRFGEALRDSEQALEFARGEEGGARSSLRLDLSEVHTSLGQALQALGRAHEAERAFRTAIAEIEQWHTELAADALGRSSYLAARQVPYRELAELLVVDGRGDEALAVVERAKARALADTIAAGRVDLSAALSEDERRREAELELTLVSTNRALMEVRDPILEARLVGDRDRARLALERQRAELYLAHPELQSRRPAAPEEFQRDWLRVVPAGDAIVELVVAEDHTLAFVMVRRGAELPEVRVRRLPVGAAALQPRIEDLLEKLAARHPGFVEQARALYELLWQPLEGDLAGATSVAVIPDGVLWRLPFAALRDGSGRDLVERFAIFRAPSLWALARDPRPRKSGEQPLRLFALANPPTAAASAGPELARQRGVDLGPLPDAEREARQIGRMYGRGNAEVLVGAAARERAFKQLAGGFDVIHLATHGLLDDRAPLYSALVLAASPADGEDGLLEAREIAGLDLRADVVVLAACDTGRGTLRAGEGVIGMSWALLAAGVPTAVVGDWQADSAATAVLMVALHRHLLAGVAPAEALRRAQLAVGRDSRFAHPYYWAAFVVTGDGWGR